MSTAATHRVRLYALGGAFIGACWGTWTLASRPAEQAVIVHSARPPAQPSCPDGYVRAEGYDPRAQLDGSRARWLARCDPRETGAAISESIELFWSDEVFTHPQTADRALEGFVRSVAQSSELLLEPIAASQPGTLGGQVARVLTVQGSFRLPPMFMHAWVLPAGRNSVQVTLLGPASQRDALVRAATGAIERVRGLRAFESEGASARGWNVEAQCPEGFSDATQPGGGRGESTYVGRYCLKPSAAGGAELTFTEVAARPADARGVGRLLEVVTTGAHESGLVADNARFSEALPVRVAGVEGYEAGLDASPPPARLTMRGYLTGAGAGSIYALGLSMHDHAEPVRAALDAWAQGTHLLTPYDGQVLADRKKARLFQFILVPAVLTALFGALIAVGRNKGLLSFTPPK